VSFVATDLRGALRGLLRSRSVLLLAVGCMALGLGTGAAMLGLLDVLLFRAPAHVREAGAVRRLYLIDTMAGVGEFTTSVLSYPVFRDLLATRAFQSAGAFFATDVSLGQGAAATKAAAVLVTPDFLFTLGVLPERGRLFDIREGRPESRDFVALVSDELAHRALGGPDAALEKRISIGRETYTVVGILPPRFTGVDFAAVDVWLPLNAAGRLVSPKWAESRGSKFLSVVARLRPDVAASRAAQEATIALRAGAAAAGRPRPAARIQLGPIQAARGPEAPSSVRVATWLAGLSWIVLLISCANVSCLLLSRGIERRSELGMRLALGASPSRLATLALCEGGVIAGLGGLGGAALVPFLGALVQRVVLPEAGVQFEGLHPRTLALLAALAAAAGLVSALFPALWVSRRALLGSLRSGVRESGPGRSRLQDALAAAQLAFTFVLLVAAGGFGWSLYNALRLPLGLDADRVLVASADLEAAGYPPPRIEETFLGAMERVRRLPGVARAARAATIPFATSVASEVAVSGLEKVPELPSGGPYLNAVSADFFTTMGTPILKGRPFSARDTAASEPVAIVNATMERLLAPGQGVLGRCIRMQSIAGAPCSTIVGVVADARRSELQEEPTMQWYLPLGQAPQALSSRALFVRVQRDPRALAGAVRREIQALSPDLPFVEVQPLSDLIEPQIHPWRMGAAVLALFAFLALGLALAGLYGVLAAAMARRRYELGVRTALGAGWRQILGLALRHGLRIALAGVAAGVALAGLAAGRLKPLLFHVSALHPLLLVGATLAVLAAALLASYVPARRTRRIDLASVLRAD
jgi:putative ABC transport system permease protein